MAHLSQKIHPVQDFTMVYSSINKWIVTNFYAFVAELWAPKLKKENKKTISDCEQT